MDMFDRVFSLLAVPGYLRQQGSEGRVKMTSPTGEEIPVGFAMVGDIDIESELFVVGESEEERKIERREMEIEKTSEEQLFAKVTIDGDPRSWAIERVADAGAGLTTLHLRRRHLMRDRVRGKRA